MSAVMSTLSIISGGGRARRKLASSRKSGQWSDAGVGSPQHELHRHQRSASLQTLEAGGGGVVNLDSLEAKMASIEVSLAGRRRSGAAAGREEARELDSLRAALTDKDELIQNLKKQLSASLSAARLSARSRSPDGASEEEPPAPLSEQERRALGERAAAVREDLDARRRNIHELRRRLDNTHVTDNIDTRIQQAELQYQLGREELELLSLGEQARALATLMERADAAARRHHAPTLYSTVRECGGTATVVAAEAREGAWGCALARGAAAGALVDWPGDHPALQHGDRLVEVNGCVVVACRSQEELQRAAGARSPARLVLLRGTARGHPHQHPHDALNQHEAASLRCELGALRAAAEAAERAKEGLRSDNTRLTHRISYLEEQVAELLARHTQLHSVSSTDSSCVTVNKTKKNVTNISITSAEGPPRQSPRPEVQVFQKGPDITALVAKLPGLAGAEGNLPVLRPRSNASGASSRAHAASPRTSPAPATHAPRSCSAHGGESRAGRAGMRHSLSHQCVHAAAAAGDYGAATDAAIRMIERNQRHMERQRLGGAGDRPGRARGGDLCDSDADARPAPRHEMRKAADRIEESIKKTNWAERKTLSIIEQLKRSQRLRKQKKNESAEDVRAESEKHHMCRRIDGKVLENAHKSSRRSSRVHTPRSAKSSELESECSDYPGGGGVYGSSPRIDYCSEACRRGGGGGGGATSGEERRDGDGRARPTPPRKPLRLSLHRARSAHSLEAAAEAPPGGGKRPVKRAHAAGAGAAEAPPGPRATPRPSRRSLGGSRAPSTPAADALYPDHHAPANWC